MAHYKEIGVSGLTQFSGYVHEEVLSELSGTRWRDTLKRMLANDSTVNALSFVLEMLIRQASWKLEPADESNEAAEIKEFFDGALFEDLETSWQDTLAEIVSFVSWGWSVHEICYKRRTGERGPGRFRSRFDDGRIGWRRFAGRSQDSLEKWEFDAEDNAVALIQRSPVDGMTYTIPLAKCLHFRTSTAKNNPEGRSIFRGAYRAWYFKSRLENIEAIGTERDLAGLPTMYVPDSLMKNTATAEEVALRNSLKAALKSIRRDENEGVMLPALYDDRGNSLFKLELLSTGGQRQFDTDKIINRYKREIFSVALADFMMLGSEKVGSFALSTDKTEMFSTAIAAFLDVITEQVNCKAIPDLGRLNGFQPELLPRLAHGDVEKIPLAEIFDALQKMSAAGFVFDEEQQNWFKGQLKMPVAAGSEQ